MKHITKNSGSTLLGILIEVLPTDPLGGLLDCVAESGVLLPSQSRAYISVEGGSVSLQQLERCHQRYQQAEVGLELMFTRILVPEGEEEFSLRPRRDEMSQVLDCRGKRMLHDPQWKAVSGRRYRCYDQR